MGDGRLFEMKENCHIFYGKMRSGYKVKQSEDKSQTLNFSLRVM